MPRCDLTGQQLSSTAAHVVELSSCLPAFYQLLAFSMSIGFHPYTQLPGSPLSCQPATDLWLVPATCARTCNIENASFVAWKISIYKKCCDWLAQVHDLEQQLHDANSNHQALAASNKQLEQQTQSLSEQLQTAQQACQEAQTQLREQQAAFEEESAAMHTLASRHKEERASLESDKQTLNASIQELTRVAEVRLLLPCVCVQTTHVACDACKEFLLCVPAVNTKWAKVRCRITL